MTDPIVCTTCGNPPEAGHRMPLCSPCRSTLSRRPFPRAIKLAAVVVGIAVIMGLAQAPRSIRGAVAFEHGQRAEASGDFAVAIEQYQNALNAFTKSSKVVLRLAVALSKNGHHAEGLELVNTKLVGKKLDHEIVEEAQKVFGNRDVPANASAKEGI